jgi:hypothetical protein
MRVDGDGHDDKHAFADPGAGAAGAGDSRGGHFRDVSTPVAELGNLEKKTFFPGAQPSGRRIV